MEIPSLPTDNLYKFMAIFGMVLFIVSGVAAPFIINQRTKDLIEFESDQLRINNTSFNDSLGVKLTEKLIFSLLELGKHRELTKEEIIYRDSLGEINKKYSNGFINGVIEKERNSKLVRTVELESNALDIFSKIGIFFGWFLTILGFYLWFTNLQVYQDLLLKKELGYDITNLQLQYNKIRAKVAIFSGGLGILITMIYFETPVWACSLFSFISIIIYNLFIEKYLR